MNHRFIERDFLTNQIKSNSEYITDDDIADMLDGHYYSDITFILTPTTKNTFRTVIIDNNTNEEISLDELNTLAFNYYLRLVKYYSVQQQTSNNTALENKAKECINKLKELMKKWKEEDNKQKNQNYAYAQ